MLDDKREMLKKKKKGNQQETPFLIPKQHSNGTNAVKHELVLTTEKLIAAAVISLQHLLGERVHLV
jgi:hypothetical protein